VTKLWPRCGHGTRPGPDPPWAITAPICFERYSPRREAPPHGAPARVPLGRASWSRCSTPPSPHTERLATVVEGDLRAEPALLEDDDAMVAAATSPPGQDTLGRFAEGCWRFAGVCWWAPSV